MIRKLAKIPIIKKVVKGTFLYDIGNKILDRVSPNGLPKYKIKRLIGKNPTILEIGTNDGMDSVTFFQIVPNVKMYCFEPHPIAAERFRRRISELKKRKKVNCRFFEVAISDKDGTAKFNACIDDNYSAQSSLKSPKNILKDDKSPSAYGKKITVKTQKLDTWYEKNNPGVIDFIWADVEGAERELIHGGKKTLNKKTKYLYTEFSDNEEFENQPKLKEILSMLPQFELIGIYGNNALLRNKKIN